MPPSVVSGRQRGLGSKKGHIGKTESGKSSKIRVNLSAFDKTSRSRKLRDGRELEKRRRESTLLPTNEDQANEENEDRLETQMDTTRLNTEEPLQPARRPRNDYDRSLNSEQSAKLLKKLSNKSGS